MAKKEDQNKIPSRKTQFVGVGPRPGFTSNATFPDREERRRMQIQSGRLFPSSKTTPLPPYSGPRFCRWWPCPASTSCTQLPGPLLFFYAPLHLTQLTHSLFQPTTPLAVYFCIRLGQLIDCAIGFPENLFSFRNFAWLPFCPSCLSGSAANSPPRKTPLNPIFPTHRYRCNV